MVKILQMARWYFPHVGGASIRVHQIAKNLSKGNEVFLLVHNPKSIEQCNLSSEAPLRETKGSIHINRLRYLPIGRKLNWLTSIPIMGYRGWRIARKCDVILSHNPPYLIGASSVIASYFSRKPLIVIVHDVWGASHYGRLKTKLGKWLEGFTLRRAKRIITVSEGLSKILKAEYNIDSVVAPTGIDPELFYPRKAKKMGRCICFVGIMREWAGVQHLIEAFAIIHKKYDDAWLLLVGSGGDQVKFAHRISDLGLTGHVVFTGAVPYEQVPEYIAQAEVCVAPFPSTKVTDQEKLMSPHKVLEYMACGKPIVASAVGGMEQYIQNDKTGLLVEPENEEELAEKVAYLLEHPQFAEELGKNAREAIKEHTWKASTAIIEQVIKESI